MNKPLILLGLLMFAGCASNLHPLPMVEDKDPVVQLNPDKWSATVNDLMGASDDGYPRPTAQAVPLPRLQQ